MLKFLILGVISIVLGIFIPKPAMVTFLEQTTLNQIPTDRLELLLQGVFLFKTGLVLLGIFFIITPWLPISRKPFSNIAVTLEPTQKTILSLVGVALFFAAVLRFLHLNDGLWYDEILTYVNYMKMPIGKIITTYDSQNQHFLYTITARIAFYLFGEGAWSLRLPAVFFGVASLVILFLLGRLVAGDLEAFLATLLLTFSYHHIWFSQNARGYTALLFWTLLSSLYLLQAIQTDKTSKWISYAISTALGIYTHLTMIFVFMSHFIIFFAFSWRGCKRIKLLNSAGLYSGFCLAGLLSYLLYSLVLPQFFSGVIGQGVVVSEWKNPIWTIIEFVKGIELGFASSFSAIIALFVIGLGLYSYWRTNRSIALLFLLPSIVGASVLIALGHHLWPRFFFFVLGFASLVLIRGLMLLGSIIAQPMWHLKNKQKFIGTTLCFAVIALSTISLPGAYGPKQDFVSALNFIRLNTIPGDAVATAGMAIIPYRDFLATEWTVVEMEKELKTLQVSNKRVWLIYTMPIHLQAFYPGIMALVSSEFQIVKKFYGTLRDGTVYICRFDRESI